MRFSFLLAFAATAALFAQSDNNSFLIQNATVHPVSGPPVANGSILVQNGKIMGVGQNLSAPKGVRVIEGKGLHVYPGMIDSASEIGLSEIESIRETNDINELGDFNPQLRALIAVNPESEHIPITRVNGITSVISLPSGGLIPGQAALIHLDGWTWEEMALSRAPAMVMRFPVIQTISPRFAAMMGGNAPRPSFVEAKRNYDEQVRKMHDFFEQARRYQQAKAHPGPDFRADLKLEAMQPVIEGKQPLLVMATRERAIHDAVEFADKEKVKIILADVREPGKMLPVLKQKNIPVILPRNLELPLNEDDPYDASYTLPKQLYDAGVKFAIASFSTEFSRNLPWDAANAVAFGLPHDEALKAVTLNAAQILGVGDKVGSIEEGKVADLIIADGDILETRTQIKQLFINGKPVPLTDRQIELYEKYKARP